MVGIGGGAYILAASTSARPTNQHEPALSAEHPGTIALRRYFVHLRDWPPQLQRFHPWSIHAAMTLNVQLTFPPEHIHILQSPASSPSSLSTLCPLPIHPRFRPLPPFRPTVLHTPRRPSAASQSFRKSAHSAISVHATYCPHHRPAPRLRSNYPTPSTPTVPTRTPPARTCPQAPVSPTAHFSHRLDRPHHASTRAHSKTHPHRNPRVQYELHSLRSRTASSNFSTSSAASYCIIAGPASPSSASEFARHALQKPKHDE
ncbi:hypothetical protein C8J57DRAFT_1512780 [Mycena rebaudengoi]|nr:hypothetical protein C8J57DRAFT_1512780 [Mycena rebaudengoi]